MNKREPYKVFARITAVTLTTVQFGFGNETGLELPLKSTMGDTLKMAGSMIGQDAVAIIEDGIVVAIRPQRVKGEEK